MNSDQSLGQCPGHTLMNNLIPTDLDPVSCCRRKKTEDLVEEQQELLRAGWENLSRKMARWVPVWTKKMPYGTKTRYSA